MAASSEAARGAHNIFRQRFERWLQRRLPPGNSFTLSQKILFIFPSAQGMAFLGLILLLWLCATNYENNLLLALCFLLISLFHTAILASFRNLAGLHLEARNPAPVFCGDHAELDLQLSEKEHRERVALRLAWRDEPSAVTPLTCHVSGADTTVSLFISTRQRGWLRLPRLTVSSVYPLGFFRVWTHLGFDVKTLVYPRPVAAGPLPFFRPQASAQQGRQVPLVGDEDFAGHKPYRTGESLQQVDWKVWARRREMFCKEYSAPADESLWLDWDYLVGFSTEERLSRLSDWVLQASRLNLAYGLRLPGVELPPRRGDSQRHRALKALALYPAGGQRGG